MTIGKLEFFALCVLSMHIGAAVAEIPGPGGLISACYDSKGVIRVIDAQASQICANKETPISFNQAGPSGPAGPEGPRGPSDAFVVPLGGFSPFPQGAGVLTLATLVLPAGEYVVNALLRFRVSSILEDPASVDCDLIADGIAEGGQLDVASTFFPAGEGGGLIRVSPMAGWIEASAGFFIHVDCELPSNAGADDIAVDEGLLVAVKYADVHGPVQPPDD